jgi:hypothetical protein
LEIKNIGTAVRCAMPAASFGAAGNRLFFFHKSVDIVKSLD